MNKIYLVITHDRFPLLAFDNKEDAELERNRLCKKHDNIFGILEIDFVSKSKCIN